MDDRPVLPWLRAAVFAAVCLALAEGAHRLMSPAPVPCAASLGALAAVFAAARAAAAREHGLPAITVLMLLVQGALHVWFDLAQSVPAAPSPAGLCAAMPGMPGMDPALMCGPRGGIGVGVVLHSTMGMVLAHLVAALVAAFWLWRGEAGLFRLVALLLVVARCLMAAVYPAAVAVMAAPGYRPPRQPTCRAWTRLPGRLSGLRHVVVRRGPPRRLVTA
jgi:hypothetical protein